MQNQNKSVLNPDEELKAEVVIFDIFRNIACVKVTTNKYNFIDYLHIGKFNDEWKIINVLWETFPPED